MESTDICPSSEMQCIVNQNWQKHKKCIKDRIGPLVNNRYMSDVKFIFEDEDKTISAHSFILSISSPVWERMFSDKWLQYNFNSIESIKISDVNESENFLKVLNYLYTDNIHITLNNYEDILYISHKYNIESLEQLSIEFIIKHINVKNVCEIFNQTHLFDNQIREKCLEFIQCNTYEIMQTESFCNINNTALKEILQLELMTISEYQLFTFVMNWANQACEINELEVNTENKRKLLGKCLYLIRFNVMDSVEFLECIDKEPNLLTSEEIHDVIDKQQVLFNREKRKIFVPVTYLEQTTHDDSKHEQQITYNNHNYPDADIHFSNINDYFPLENDSENSIYTCNCGKFFETKRAQKIHQRKRCTNEYVDNNNKCVCGKSFNTIQGLKIHKSKWCRVSAESIRTTESLQKDFLCKCGKSFDTEHGLAVHKGRWCELTESSSSSKISIEDQQTHSTLNGIIPKSFPCKCGKSFDTEQGLAVHKGRWCEITKSNSSSKITIQDQQADSISKRIIPESFPCKCGKSFDTERGLAVHNGRWCELTESSLSPKFTIENQYADSTFNSIVPKNFLCKCGKSFNTEHGLAVHKGQWCELKVPTRAALVNHQIKLMSKLLSIKNFQCKCGKSFDTEHGLAVHKGQWCELRISTPVRLIKTNHHHIEKNFQCECGKSFETEHGLAVHKGQWCPFKTPTTVRHQPIKELLLINNFSCDGCGKSFDTKHGLAVHKGRWCTNSRISSAPSNSFGSTFDGNMSLNFTGSSRSSYGAGFTCNCGRSFDTQSGLSVHKSRWCNR